MTGLTDSDTITITTDGTYNFGSTGPTYIYRDTLSSYSSGDTLATTPPVGRCSITTAAAGSPKIGTASSLPYGVGVEMGIEQAQPTCHEGQGATYRQLLMIDTAVELQFFQHMVMHHSQAVQDLIETDDARSSCAGGWQHKTWWHYQTPTGYAGGDGYPDITTRTPGGSASYDDCCRFASNDVGRVEYHGFPSMRHESDTTRLREDPMIEQLWVKSNSVAGTYTDSNGVYYLFDTAHATPLRSTNTYGGFGWAVPGETPGFDRHTFPGYVRGYNRPDGYAMMFGDLYLTTGVGAVCRVVLSDSATFTSSKKQTLMTITSWSASSVTGNVVKGLFWAESLIGKHIHIFKSDNTSIYVGQIA